MMLLHHFMANLPERWWKSGILPISETIMLGVFMTLLYTHTMPNIYYCSTCMLLHPHLMTKLALKLAGN